MGLPRLLDAIEALPAFARVHKTIPGPGQSLRVGGLAGSADAVFVAALARALPQRLVVVITDQVGDAERWLADLQSLVDDIPVALYPPREGFGEVEPHAEVAGERVETLEKLGRSGVRLLLTTARAVLEQTALPRALAGARLELRKGDVRRLEDLTAHLESIGCERVPMVEDVAQFSVRGARNPSRQIYEVLRENVDYYVDPSQLWIALVRPLNPNNERLAVAYEVNVNGTPGRNVNTGGTPDIEFTADPQYANLLWEPELQPTNTAYFLRELKSVYRLGGEDLQRQTIKLKLVTGTSGDQEKPIDPSRGETYLQLFGLTALAKMWRLMAKAADEMPEIDEDYEEAAAERLLNEPLKLAIVGRPNAGKSTLINRMLGQDRLITGPEAGITRDSIAIDWEYPRDGVLRPVRLIDTAGLRRRSKVTDKLETLSAADTKYSVDFAEVVVLLLDATLGLEAQDLRIADMVLKEGRALIIALNKWDAAHDQSSLFQGVRKALDEGLAQIKGVPLIAISGLTGKNIDILMKAAFEARDAWSRRVSTSQLNRWFEAALERNPPPAPNGRRIKLRYVTQAATRPPTFVVFGNRLDELPESYRRYLIGGMRDTLGFDGVPIRLTLRGGKNPFA